jgi:photosystem II stability/assembly factor-like uncharacterized protein
MIVDVSFEVKNLSLYFNIMTTTYTSSYAMPGYGGFTIDQTFPTYRPQLDSVRPYYVAEAIQVKYSVRELNYKIGLVNDLSENIINLPIPSSGNAVANTLEITSDEFLNNTNKDTIVSMGKISTMYTDFLNAVNVYFGSPIILANNIFNVNNGVFDAEAFIHLLNGGDFNINGTLVSDLSGSLLLYDIQTQLQNAIDSNMFNNRTSSTSISDGFKSGDLIFIPEGMTITLRLNIDLGANTDLYTGPENLQQIDDQLNYYDRLNRVRKTTTYSDTELVQTFTVPVLIIASDEEVYSFNKYALNWTPEPTEELGIRDWNFCSLSSTGQYQSAIDLSGDIFISTDFGETWRYRYNIGPSNVNAINITHDGQHLTASNGSSIHVSNDFGNTWSKALDTQGTIVYVSISLNGRYQKVVISGDSLYSSNDYGVSWSRLNDDSPLYYSIQAFPTMAVSISYNGQYQVIAAETIYLSSDYGATFNDSFTGGDPFEDRNWLDIAVTSDGQYMLAIESGGKIYISSNYGSNWNIVTDSTVNIDASWRNVAISATGRHMSILRDNGFIYYSTDFGVTWSQNTDTNLQGRQWRCVAVSANGHYQLAAELNGYVYMSNLN